MPWTPKQHRLFQAAAHNPAIAKSAGIPQAKAAKMANEGVKMSTPKKPPAASASMVRPNKPKPKPSPEMLARVLEGM